MSLGNIGDYLNENWHGGQMDGDYFEHPEMLLEENDESIKENKKLVWNWKNVMTRELMRGHHKSEILAKYGNVIDRFDIRKEVLDFLNKNDGVLGWFIIDVSNFDDKFGYDDIPDEMRVCNMYALNATELREVISRSLVSENDGTVDGFLNTEDSLAEEINYIDECTGLPCIDGWNGESDDDDERLNKIVDIFLGRKWMTLSEKNQFNKIEGKLPYLVSIVRRHFAPKSNSNDKFEDDVKDFDIRKQELEADSQKALKDAEVNNIHEIKLDDIGNVDVIKPLDVEQKKDKGFGNIDTDIKVDYGKVDDNLNELKKQDFKDDFEFDNSVSDFVIDDIDDMKDDEFDYADLNNGDVDMDELMDEDSINEEVNVEEAPEEVEISNKYDWSW